MFSAIVAGGAQFFDNGSGNDAGGTLNVLVTGTPQTASQIAITFFSGTSCSGNLLALNNYTIGAIDVTRGMTLKIKGNALYNIIVAQGLTPGDVNCIRLRAVCTSVGNCATTAADSIFETPNFVFGNLDCSSGTECISAQQRNATLKTV